MNENHHDHFLLQQIECNTLPILELTKEVEEIFAGTDDLRYDDITILLQALSRNDSIRCVRFEGDFLDCLHPLRRSDLLRAVGSYLPSLRHLGLGDSPVMLADLLHLVTKSKSLRSLHLHDSVLQGSVEEFRALQEALKTHPSIQEFEIHECTSSIPGTNLEALRNAGKRKSSTRSYQQGSTSLPYQQRFVSLLNRKRFDVAKRRDFETKI